MNMEGTTLCGKTTTRKACVCTFICRMSLTWKLLEKEKQLVAAGGGGGVTGSAESGVEMSSYQYQCVAPMCGRTIEHSHVDTLNRHRQPVTTHVCIQVLCSSCKLNI